MPVLIEVVLYGSIWYLAALAGSLPAFALTRNLFPRRFAWPIARIAGSTTLAWLVLLPSVFTTVPFTLPTVIAAAAVVGAVAYATRRDAAVDRRSILHTEIFLAIVFFGLAFLYTALGGLDTSDQLRDAVVWSYLLRRKIYPIDDPWLRGIKLTYYYFGYFPLMVTQLIARVPSSIAYGMAMAWSMTTFAGALALTVLSLGFRPITAALGGCAIAFATNFYSLASVPAVLFGSAAFDGPGFYWPAEDYYGQSPIGLFFWKALHGDFMALWTAPLLLALASPFREQEDETPVALLAVTGGLLTGWTYGTNAWHVPVLAGLTVLGCLMHARRPGPRVVALGVIAFFAAAAPFFQLKRAAPLQAVLAPKHSTLSALLGEWGLWLLPILGLLALRAARRKDSAWAWGAALLSIAAWEWFRRPLAAAAIVMLGVYLARSRDDRAGKVAHVLLTLTLLTGTSYQGGPLVALLVAIGIHAWRTGEDRDTRASGWFLTLGALLLALVEIVAVKEDWGRMNTVLKFNIIAWPGLGLAALLAARALIRPLPVWGRRVALGGWAASLAAGTFLTIYELQARDRVGLSLDQISGLARKFPDDARLVEWIRANADKLSGTMLEGPDKQWSWGGRVSALTGLPQYEQFTNHNSVHEIFSDNPEIARRLGIARAIYRGELPCARLCETLRAEGIDFVVAGEHERARVMRAEGLAKLEACLPTVARFGNAALLGGCPRT